MRPSPLFPMKTPRPSSLQHYLSPAILGGALLAVYGMTLAPGLSWANNGSDGGDLISAAATGGVAHPTGYPLYLLLARLFQWLPFGSLAYRTNLLSAVTMALASVLVYWLVVRHTRGSTDGGWAGGLAAGFAFGLSPLVWSQAVIAEVYGLQALIVVLLLCLCTAAPKESPTASKRLDRWRGFILGLGVGNHLTTLLLAPVLLVSGSMARVSEPPADRPSGWLRNFRMDRGALLRQLGMFALGLSVYLILPLRALGSPAINWGDPVTPARFWWLVSGQLYQSYYLQFSPSLAWERVQVWPGLFLEQFGLPWIVLGLIGLFVLGRVSRLYLLTLWTAIASTAFAVVYISAYSEVYLIPVLLAFAVWTGLGTNGLIGAIGPRSWSPVMVVVLIVTGYFAARSATVVGQVDASRDLRAEAFGREVLAAAPRNAMVFAREDHSVFTLWYFHFALGERPDLAIVAADLLHFDWYVETLKAQYPALEISAPLPWPETIIHDNPARPFCYVEYIDRTAMDCTVPEDVD